MSLCRLIEQVSKKGTDTGDMDNISNKTDLAVFPSSLPAPLSTLFPTHKKNSPWGIQWREGV